jgi:uncharacterized protein (DUF302 family)
MEHASRLSPKYDDGVDYHDSADAREARNYDDNEHRDRVAGELGLMILGTVPHGRLYRLLEDGPPRAQMFLIGNPLIALNMMRVHAESGVYAPLRLMFSEDGSNKTVITYDRPSKMFAQWQESVFQQTGQILDQKMQTLIRKLAE